MESLNSEDAADRMILNNKLRSPNQMSETNTMDSFQDGGQQNMSAEASDFPPQMEGSHMNSDMNSFPPSSGDHSMGPDNFNRMSDGMHPSQMQNYNAFNRGNYNMGDQHGGMSMAGSMEFGGHSSQYHGQYSHSGMRPAYPGMSKPGMTPSRPGMVPPGMSMMASSSPAPGQRMMSGQSLSQATGPTPTLNQLLQTPNSSSQRYQNSYGEFGPGGSKGGEMGGGGGSAPMPYNPMQANWPGSQRMGGYPQGHMPGAASFRNQSGSFSEMSQQRRPMPSSYSQSGQFGGQQQYHPGSQRYGPGMMPGQPRPGPGPAQMPPMNTQQMHPQFGQHGNSGQMGFNPGGASSQQQQQQQMYMSQQPQPPGPSPPQPLPPTSQQTPQKPPPSSQAPSQQPSPAPAPTPTSTSTAETSQSQGSESSRTHGTKRSADDDSSRGETAGEENSQENSGARRTPTPSGSHHPPSSTHHIAPSPASSTGSRSNTPASVSGPQAGSPMPPRPSSGQHDAASRMSHSPMTTQGYNQQMMPPPMGPNQMGGYAPGTPSSKMMGGMMGSQMGHYPQYPNSQYPSGNYPRQQTMPPSMGSGSGGMQGFAQQSMYNGPSQMGGNPLYGGPMGMNRSSTYPGYGQGGMPMNSQYPGFSNHMGGQPGQGGPMPGGSMPPGASSMNSINQPPGMNMNMQGAGMPPNMPGGPGSMSGLVPGPGMPGGPGGMPGPGGMSGGPGGAMPGSGMAGPGGMGGPGAAMPGGPGGVKGAQAAAQAAMIAAANSSARQQGGNRSSGGKTPTSSSGPGPGTGPGPGPGPGPGGPTPPRMYTPPPGGHVGGPMNHVNFGNPSLNSLSNTVNQLGNSMTPCSSVPNAMGPSSGPSTHPNSATGLPPSSSAGGPSGPHGGAPHLPPGVMEQGPSGPMGPGGKGPEPSAAMQQQQQSGAGPDAKEGKGSEVSVNGAASGKPGENVPPSTTAGEGRTLGGGGSGVAPGEGALPSSQPSSDVPTPSTQQPTLAPASCTPESMQQPITTTANTNVSDGLTTSVTQSITQPVTSVPASSSNSLPSMPQQQQTSQGCPPPGMPAVPNCVPMPSFPEEPPEKKKKKSGSSDLSKLYEMGSEPDRKSFLDRVLAYLEEKGSPITTMPAISKQPLDLYRLYREVQSRGGMVEVNKAKKWKEICGVVNIGSSASAAFTLKKNYIKYLFNFECKYDRDDQDPVPILAQMEAQLQQKREQKNKRAPSPGSQGSSQDAFRPPSTPNSQMMDPFSPSMPPHFMQNSDGSMVPPGMPGNMMPPNNMMGGMNPNMMPPGSMGSNMPPHPQMMGNNPNMQGGMMGGHGQGMMGGNGPPPNSMMGGSMGSQMPPGNMPPGQMMGSMGPSQGMMGGSMGGPNNGMMSGGSFNGPPQNGSMMGSNLPPHPSGMMGGSGGAMGPPVSSGAASSAGPPSTGAPGTASSDSISVQDPFADEPNSSAGPHYSWSSGGSGMPPYQQQPGPHGSGFSYGGRPGPGGPGSAGSYQGMSQNTPLNNMEGMARLGPSGEGFGESYRRGMPPNAAEGFSPGSSSGRTPVDSFPTGPGGSQQFPTRPPHSSSGGQFPFVQQFDRPERFDQSSGGHPGQQFRPSQSGMMPPGAEGGYTPRTYSGQQMPGMRPPHPPQEGGYSSTPSSQSYPGQSGGYGGPRPPVGQDQCGIYSGPSTGFPGPRPPRGDLPGSMYGTPSKRFPEMDRGPSDHRRDASQWSPMTQRYASASGNFTPSMAGMPAAPGTPPMGPFSRSMGHRASPQARDKMMMSKQQKPCTMLPNSQYPPKKEIVFPPDTVEAVEPHHTKRRRLNNKDIGPLEAWRLMMGLKSGLLAESTWAIDSLNILLYDDSTVGYFNLVHLPGLLEVLLEHFRRCLIQIFGIFKELEIGFEKAELAEEEEEEEEEERDGGRRSEDEEEEEKSDKGLVARLKAEGDLPNYTLVSRNGKTVKVEEESSDSWVHDRKKWDVFCGFNGGAHHWQIGCGDITSHIITQFTGNNTHKLFRRIFFKNRTSEKENESDQGKKCGKVKEPEGVLEVSAEERGEEEVEEEEAAAATEVNGHGEEKMEVDEEVPQKKDHSEACHKSKLRNNFMKDVQIKTEPRDPELDGFDSSDATTMVNDSTPAESKKTEVKSGSPKSLVKSESEGSPQPETQKAPSKPNSPKSSSPPSSASPSDPKSSTAAECPTSPKSIKKEAKEEETPMEEDNNNDTEGGSTQNNSTEDGEGPPVLSQEVPVEVKHTEEERSVMRQMLSSCQLFVKEEEEAFTQDELPLCTTAEGQEELGLRCVCLSNIFRSLSCIPGNETEMSNHPGLIRVLGQLLLLNHTHPPRAPKSRRSFVEQEGDELLDTTDECGPPRAEWWWDHLLALRENALVIFANISGHLDLSKYPEEVCFPVLDGLLHWAVCPSSCARDPMPFQTAGSTLSPQRLVLEALCKLCIHDANVDLLLATPPFARIVDLFGNLSRLLANKKEQVTQEFAIVLMSELVAGDSCAARAVALHHPTISLLVDFLEAAEQEAMRVVSSQGMHVLQSNPEGMLGTSLDMLRRAANILLHLSRVPENRALFSRHQPRLLALVMSQILDSSVAQIVSDVLYECSQSAS